MLEMKAKVNLRYWFAQHPRILHFRWDHNIWGSSFDFLAFSILTYLFLLFFLKLVMKSQKKPLRLGRIAAMHKSTVLAMSVIILVGCWEAAAVEIKETRWLWRNKNAAEYMVCFPLGTRSTGRVFFWSYVFYLTKYYELLDTMIMILRKEPLTFLHVLSNIVPIFVCFFWLEFSQSLQILCILTNTVMNVIIYCDFFIGRGRPELKSNSPRCTRLASYCRMVEFAMAFVGNMWVVWLHLRKEGCNGMVGCLLNACCNAILCLLLMRCQKHGQRAQQLSTNQKPAKI